MKFASYNIMSGGFSAYSYEIDGPQRLPQIQTVLNQLNADVIGLVDTFRWDEIYSEEQLHQLFGYKYVACINLNDDRLRKSGHNNGLALFSRVPWESCVTVRIRTRDALKAQFLINGRSLTVFVVYLDDLSEDTRLQQVEALLQHITDPENTLIMGDLNTLLPNPNQLAARGLQQFSSRDPVLYAKLEPVIQDMQRGAVLRKLSAEGFIDVGVDGGPTAPTHLFSATREPFLRLDYCLRTPGVDVRNFKVFTSKDTQSASDHLPITFEVN